MSSNVPPLFLRKKKMQLLVHHSLKSLKGPGTGFERWSAIF